MDEKARVGKIQDRRRTCNSHDLEGPMDEEARVGKNPRQEAGLAIIRY